MIPALEESTAIAEAIGHYTEGARTGDVARMKAAFHPDAQIFGFLQGEPFFGPIQILFDWDEKNGPAPDIQTQITSIDMAGTVACVRLEIENWTGIRFTDFFTLCKIGDRWLVMNKVFHRHN
jgi:hypothetical protein